MGQKPLCTSAPGVTNPMSSFAETVAYPFIIYRNYAKSPLGKKRPYSDASSRIKDQVLKIDI
jgi:hypothetical protein